MEQKTLSLVFLQYLTTVFDNITDAVLLIGVEKGGYRLLLGNKAFFETSGHSPDDVGKRIVDVVGKDNYPSLSREYQRAIKAKKPTEFTHWYTVPRGRSAFRVKILPIISAVGEVVQLVVLTHDITEQVRLQNEVEGLRAALETVRLTVQAAAGEGKRSH
jgi:PAS domain S-box-containing protein